MPLFLADLIVAQTKHETGNYTSNAFTQLNNAIGYAFYPQSDWQLKDPGFIADNSEPLARYATVANSIHELTHWIRRRQYEGSFPDDLNQITTAEQYATLLKSDGYYGDSITNYVNGIVRYFKANVGGISTAAIFIVVAAVVLFLAYSNNK